MGRMGTMSRTGGYRLGSGHPQKIIQSPDGLNKAPKHYTKTQNIRQNLQTNMQNPQKNEKNQKHETRVATNISLTSNIKYPILKPHILIKKVLILIKGN